MDDFQRQKWWDLPISGTHTIPILQGILRGVVCHMPALQQAAQVQQEQLVQVAKDQVVQKRVDSLACPFVGRLVQNERLGCQIGSSHLNLQDPWDWYICLHLVDFYAKCR